MPPYMKHTYQSFSLIHEILILSVTAPPLKCLHLSHLQKPLLLLIVISACSYTVSISNKCHYATDNLCYRNSYFCSHREYCL